MLQMHNGNYENNPKHCKQKGTQCNQYLKRFHNPYDGNISTIYILQN
jgi:hypothetical protein